MSSKLICSLFAAASLIAGVGSAAAAELTYGAGIPANSDEITLGVNAYAEQLGKMSKDGLTMKVLAGGQVVSLENTLANLRDGTIDAGFVVPTFTRKELKSTNVIYDTEVFGDDPAAITGAANETLLLDCPNCIKEFHDNGAIYIGSFGNDNKGLICRKPVKTLEDVKGLKIRAVGATTRLIAAMGGVPVVMNPADATTALDRGTIDCVHGVLTWLQNFGYWDVAHYMLETPLGSPRTISSVVFSKRAWDKMSLADKKMAVDEVPMHLARMVYLVNVRADGLIKEKAIKDHHVTFYQGGNDFTDMMAQFQKKETFEIPEMDEKQLGVTNAKEIFTAFIKNLDKWEKLAKATDMKNDMNAMAAAYKREIYDKIDPAKL